MEFEIARTRRIYATAERAIALLPPRPAACVGAALELYSRILDRIEMADHDVFTVRARVPTVAKLAVATGCLLRRGRLGAVAVPS